MTPIRRSLVVSLVFGSGAVMCGESDSTGNGARPGRGGGAGEGGEAAGATSGTSGAAGTPSRGGSGNGGGATGGAPSMAGEGGHPSGGAPDSDGGDSGAGGQGGAGSDPGTCSDQRRNGDELGVDCGGRCAPCLPATSAVPFLAGRSSLMGLPPASGWEPADLDGDGKLDVVVSITTLVTAFGNGDGVFTRSGTVVLDPRNAPVRAHADFDGDGNDDVVTCGTVTLVVVLGSSNTPSGVVDTLSPRFAFRPSSTLTACAVGDFDSDGRPDVAAGTATGVELALNDGNRLVPGPVYTSVGRVTGLASEDVDGRFGPDLVAFDYTVPELTVLLSEGAGSFSVAPAQMLPSGVSEIAVFREVGASVVLRGAEVHVAPLAANGELGAPVLVSADRYSWMAAGDLDNDGAAELVLVRLTNEVDVFERNAQSFRVRQALRPNFLPHRTRLVDLNKDGFLDLGYLNGNPLTLDVLLNLGNGRFPDPPETGRDAKPVYAGAFGDLDGDNRPDAVIAVDSIPNSSSVDVYLSQAAGGFTKKARIPIAARAQELLVDQITGTSDADVLLMHSQTLPLVGDGTGALSAGAGIFAGPLDPVLVDIDANGERELVGSASGGAIAFARSGAFFETTSRRISPSDFPWLRSTADIDADGRADLTLTGGSSVVWMRSLGGYAFESARSVWGQPANAVLPITRGALPRRWLVAGSDGLHELVETESGFTDTRLGGETGYRMLVADWNRDGIDDVIVTGEVVSLHRGNADGSFSYSGTTLLAGGFVLAEAFFDATGDGLKDIVTVSYQGAITVLPAIP